MTFDEMGLDPKIMKAIQEVGYTEPTPIQAQAIPVVLQGKDVPGIAQTGTGKTASFTLPMIHRLMKGHAKARMPRTSFLNRHANWRRRLRKTLTSMANIRVSQRPC